MQRTRPKCSSSTLGTNENDSAPAANNLPSRLASRRSVFTKSPETFGIDPGAMTRRSNPRAVARTREREPRRPGLIHRPRRPSHRLKEYRHDIPRRAAQPLHAQFAADRIEYRRDRLRLMQIKPDQTHTLRHGSAPPIAGVSAPAPGT